MIHWNNLLKKEIAKTTPKFWRDLEKSIGKRVPKKALGYGIWDIDDSKLTDVEAQAVKDYLTNNEVQ